MCVRALKQCILKACCRISVRRPAARTSMKIFPDPPPVNRNPPPALPPTNPARPLRHSRGGMTEELQSAPATHRTRSDCSGEKMGPVGLTDQNNPPEEHTRWQLTLFPFRSSALSLPLTAWCSPFASIFRRSFNGSQVCRCEGRWVVGGGAPQRFMKDFHFFSFVVVFQNLNLSPDKRSMLITFRSAGDADADILWKPWISRRDQTRRASWSWESVRVMSVSVNFHWECLQHR